MEDSDTESAYFTSDETSVPPPHLPASDASDQLDLPKNPRLNTSHGLYHGSDEQFITHTVESSFTSPPITIESDTSPAQASFPSHEIDASSIPRDKFAVKDDNTVQCRPCKKKFASFERFKQHFRDSPVHSTPTTTGLPPPLVRNDQVTNEYNGFNPDVPAFTPRPPAGVAIAADEEVFVYPDSALSIFECRTCNLHFIEASALHEHKIAQKRQHPYYCQHCFRDFEGPAALQQHYRQADQCPRVNPLAAFNRSEPVALAIAPAHAQISADTLAQDLVTSKRRNPQHTTQMTKMPGCVLCSEVVEDCMLAAFCGHLYCATCVLDHLRDDNECPKCGKLLTTMMLIPLYM